MAASFERHGGKQLPITFIETIRAGELSGTLDRSFATLKDYYEKSYKNAEKIKSAMTYPIFVVLVAIVVLIVVMAKVIPALAGTFSSLGGDLPLITQIMIDASNFFAKWYILMLLVVLALVVAYKLYAGTQQGRLVIGKIMLNMPVLGPINVFHGAAQFADTMSAMLQSGLTVNRAVEVTAKVMDNAILQEDVSSMIPKIEEGRSLGDCIRATKDFPDNLKEMCAIGEESGSLDATLTTIADYYHNEEDHATTQAIAKMEPTMMVFLAVFAGFIVISIYLPMFTMYNLM
jgi:type IV pilus assembly protein PilC